MQARATLPSGPRWRRQGPPRLCSRPRPTRCALGSSLVLVVQAVTSLGPLLWEFELVAKRLELLHEILPGITRIALLVNRNNPGLMQDNIELSKAAVRRLGLEMIVVKAGSESEIESAVGEAVAQQAKALSIGNDAYLSSRSRQIAFFALRHALPTMSESRDGVAAGLLVSYGPNQAETFRRAGLYVGRILKGEKPADLPVIQPTNFELFINLTAARALGLKIPGQLLGRADELIE